MATSTLPLEIENKLNKNTLFTIFGIVNLKCLRSGVNTNLKDKELKKLINNRFAKEIVHGKIEFI